MRFRGTRRPGPISGRTGYTQVRVIEDDGREHDLPVRLDVFNHSPNGFEWGYSGSGPAQLALALLLALGIDEERAVQWHQCVKFALVAGLTADVWILDGAVVLRALKTCEHG